jgi:hypothetical protein
VIIADGEGKESVRSLPLSEYSAPGACGKARVVLQHFRMMPKPAEMGVTKNVGVPLVPIGV